ncbi:hypothetical protein Tco_0390254 [Tanacetum coccineum]
MGENLQTYCEKGYGHGQLRLPVMVGNKEHSTTAWMNFMVIRSTLAILMALLVRQGIQRITRGYPSRPNGMLKFPGRREIVTIYNIAATPKDATQSHVRDAGTQRQQQPMTNLKVAIHPDYPEQEVSIGGSLSDTG